MGWSKPKLHAPQQTTIPKKNLEGCRAPEGRGGDPRPGCGIDSLGLLFARLPSVQLEAPQVVQGSQEQADDPGVRVWRLEYVPER